MVKTRSGTEIVGLDAEIAQREHDLAQEDLPSVCEILKSQLAARRAQRNEDRKTKRARTLQIQEHADRDKAAQALISMPVKDPFQDAERQAVMDLLDFVAFPAEEPDWNVLSFDDLRLPPVVEEWSWELVETVAETVAETL